MTKLDLSGFKVLVTRPKPQGEALCAEIQRQGGETVFFPTLVLEPVSDLLRLRRQLQDLDQYDLAIFVSRHAVTLCADLIHDCWPALPPALKIAAVGEATAQALHQAKLPIHFHPTTQWNSEALLALPALQQMQNKKVAIFCAEGGRELLAETLLERGAEVTRILSYQRILPKVKIAPYLNLLKKQQVQALVCTSTEGLVNLKKLFGAEAWPQLQKIPLVLISERIMIQAKEMGCRSCFLAENASNSAILQALAKIRKELMSPVKTSPTVETQTAEAPVTKPKKRGLGFVKKFLILMLLLLLALSAIPFVYHGHAFKQQLVHSVAELSASAAPENQQQVATLQNEVAALQSQMQQQQEQLRQQAQMLQGLHQLAQASHNYWKVVNAQHFVRLASDHLILTAEIPTTINLLQQALNELDSVNEVPALKAALNQDVNNLRSLPVFDISNLYLRLLAVQKMIKELPLPILPVLNGAVIEPAHPSQEEFVGNWWQKGWQSSWQALQKIVVVRYVPSNQQPPFVAPDQRPYLYENIHSLLGSALWAVLHRDAEVYTASLKAAREWLQEYFVLSSPRTQAVLDDLAALEAISVEPAKETTLSSVAAFQDYLQTQAPASASTSTSNPTSNPGPLTVPPAPAATTAPAASSPAPTAAPLESTPAAPVTAPDEAHT